MLQYLLRRVLFILPTLFAISVVSFVIIQLPPGDFLSTLAARLEAQGGELDRAQLIYLRERYGLDQPMAVQYWRWITGIVTRGDFGLSFHFRRPVEELIWSRLGLTFGISLLTVLFVYAVAIPIGIYSAVRKYSIGDYVATFVGFIGLAIPNFLLALVLMYVSLTVFGYNPGGLFSSEFADAPWSFAKFVNLLQHLWIPIVVVGTASTASLIRYMRANLLDELPKPYVVTARAKGLPETRLLTKYPVRVASNPIVSRVGWELPDLVSGELIVAVVLSLPTTGPLLLQALVAQDMFLAGAFIMMLSVLTVIGTLLSDILLAWLDPRIRYR
ncbi:MAG: ABC transporter permease [Trueperaceae bacterium]|nr:ABC transporter permease [Trueperaceae bacterium]